MKNKIIMVLLLVVALFFLAPINVNAATLISSGTEGDYGYSIYQNQDGTKYAKIISYNTDLKKVVIPNTIAGVKVTELDVFFGSSVTEITIPNTLKTINDYTFFEDGDLKNIKVEEGSNYYISIEGCLYRKENNKIVELICVPSSTELTNITIPDGVTKIASGAFAFCSKVVSVSIPNSVISIGDDAFWRCINLLRVTIPDSVINFGESVFCGCTNLTSVSMSKKITNIGDYTFAECSSLTNIFIPNGVTSIGEYAFYECSSLKSIIIPDSVTTIGYIAFYKCSSLTNIIIPGNVTSIGNSIFDGCTNLTNVVMLNGVTSISRSMFIGCSNLTSVSIPRSVTSISDWAFAYCTSLSSITIPNSVTKVYEYTFDGWKSNQIINFESESWPGYLRGDAIVNVGVKLAETLSVDEKVTFLEKGSKILTANIYPNDAINKNVKWKSSNNAVATVDNYGKVTAVGIGECVITAAVENQEYIIDKCNVVVKSLPFTDVNKTKWYYEAVLYCYSNNIILGTSSTTFEPNTKLTRGMLATILYRMEGAPKITAENKFSDVQSGKYYYNAVLWAKKNGIVNGYSGTTRFGPNDNLTRQDLAVILSAYCNYKRKYVASNYGLTKYSDSSKISSYALPAIRWAVKNKIINGSNGNLNPKGTATRAEVAVMLYSYCMNIK